MIHILHPTMTVAPSQMWPFVHYYPTTDGEVITTSPDNPIFKLEQSIFTKKELDIVGDVDAESINVYTSKLVCREIKQNDIATVSWLFNQSTTWNQLGQDEKEDFVVNLLS